MRKQVVASVKKRVLVKRGLSKPCIWESPRDRFGGGVNGRKGDGGTDFLQGTHSSELILTHAAQNIL